MFVIKDDEGGTFSHKTIEIAFGQITVITDFYIDAPASLVLCILSHQRITRYHIEQRPRSAFPQVDTVEMLAASFMSISWQVVFQNP